ncbi:hypothetical protein BJY21_001033 [Kineosphaera limosa]|uniref:Glycosyltransferase n=1 Tax=Kineosphaera limosa NBRC 100340 TaxID=1184609 RepID=K6WZD2_9MICO|nr:hypothetical protein [Kineosphaera limosa]NYD99848.1 hypothetical protein [Kineosphaera limosa]GAB97477.1 hypothetical protein KILIM_070_00140 [Kineosphaera limosa NBRC 100340]
MTGPRALRIAFLPYQAAMWDSMASIWRAAHEDANTEVVVLPVPYDDLDPEGGVARHCPGEQLPAEVPTQSSNSFDLAAFRPDIVYVHNAYDAHNRVTRIAAPYRTDALRRLGCVLVYVPYYIVGGTLPPGQRDLVGYDNVDVIALQTPAHRPQIAARHQRKVIALGTPKADHVVRGMSDPDDGGDQPTPAVTILVTTSITEVLHHSERALARTWEVIEFAAGRADVSVIWRPHPLLASTMIAMRQRLVEPFAKMLQVAGRIPNVRIDLSPDYLPSIVASDCYIGLSPTSLALLFGVTGRPVLMLDCAANDDDPIALGVAPSFGDFEGYLPWAAADVRGDVTVSSFVDYVATGRHDRAGQVRRFEEVTGPLDGGVGARIHARLADATRAAVSKTTARR